MPNTTKGLPYPSNSDDVDIPGDIQALANAVDADLPAAKGDLLTASAANTPSLLSVGANGTVLTADSAATNGIKWASASGSGYTLQWGNYDKMVYSAMWTGTEYWLSTSNSTLHYSTSWDTKRASWTTQSDGGSGAITALAFGNSVYVAGHNNGGLYTSTNKTTWTSRTSGFSTSGIYSAAYGLNGATHTYVIAGSSGKLSSSTDSGATWTSRTSGFGTDSITCVRHLNGTFVAVGAIGKIATSTDGATWTLQTTPSATYDLYDVTYGNGTYVAVGFETIWTSTNLTSWTARTIPFSAFGDFSGVAYNSDSSTFFLVSSRGRIATSTDSGVTWTEQSYPLSGVMSLQSQYTTYVRWDGTGYVIGCQYVLNASGVQALSFIRIKP